MVVVVSLVWFGLLVCWLVGWLFFFFFFETGLSVAQAGLAHPSASIFEVLELKDCCATLGLSSASDRSWACQADTLPALF